ncbi:MAG: acyl-CoA dehydrogenase family protein [Betaproteobacteria bacterium]|jgi:acyl-CoA dehydrogenase
MQDSAQLNLPFFESKHEALSKNLHLWAKTHLNDIDCPDVDAHCRQLVGQLGRDDWLKYCVAGQENGGLYSQIDNRSICLIREILAKHSGLADFAFAMQGLGSGAISIAGSKEQKERYLPKVSKGQSIAAFALSEPHAGSDVAALSCEATLSGEHYILNGEKTWISNGGIADLYVVFARTGDAPGSRGISAFIVDKHTDGFEIAERIHVIAPHPLARIKFTNCAVPVSNRIGSSGEGFKIAMRTLDIFRTSVASAALGFAKRAFHEALERAKTRKMFNGHLADFQISQVKLAEMATRIESAELLTYKAAWLKDQGKNVTKEAAMAKMTATENAQWVIDAAVQMFGALGVVSGVIVERLYREIRALRIYEGATEVQMLIIAKSVLENHRVNS